VSIRFFRKVLNPSSEAMHVWFLTFIVSVVGAGSSLLKQVIYVTLRALETLPKRLLNYYSSTIIGTAKVAEISLL
jgi:hypothetical protein